MGDVVGGDVSPDMMHRDQRHTQGVGHRLGKAHPHQHRADEAGGVGHGYGVDVLPGQPGFHQSLVSQLADDLNVLAGGDLRHHAAVNFMHLHGGGDAVGQNGPPVLHQRHRRLIAGGFYCE